MTGILTFGTPHGTIAFEVDERIALAARGGETTGPPLVAKGALGIGAEIVATAPKSFDEAMSSLKALAASMEDLIRGMDLAPREVAVEIGLKLSGTVGFIIAKAGADTEIRVSLKWEPGQTINGS